MNLDFFKAGFVFVAGALLAQVLDGRPDIALRVSMIILIAILLGVILLACASYSIYQQTEGEKKARPSLRSCESTPLFLLKFFRWFVPRSQRDEIDLAIEDVREDVRDLKKAKKHKAFIFTVTLWHTIRIIGAYILDGFYAIIKKLLPVASFFLKKK